MNCFDKKNIDIATNTQTYEQLVSEEESERTVLTR